MPGPGAAPGAGGGDLRDPWDEGDWAAGEMLTPAEIMALEQAEGAGDDPGWLAEDADDVAPPGAAEGAGGAVAEAWDAGFTHNVAGASGRGFEAGGGFDRMLPGRDLAGLTGRVLAGGLGRVSDYELIGFMCAARRNASWQQALELFAVAELEARRAGADGRPGEHVAAEVAAALTLTGRAAETLLGLAEGITRLRQVPAALAAGVIDLKRAGVFARELLPLGDELAARAEAMVMPRAPGMTTGQLCAALQRAVLAVDPGAAQRRKKQAEKEGRVEAWGEPGRGTAALAGRDLPAAEVIAADKRLTAAARWLRGHGARGSLDWLRSVPLIPVERGECGHRLEVPGYRPSARLRHQVKTRSRRCSFPGCRRPAVACDDDHTLAWHEGGRTCECNLSPLCRMHHRAKQAPGWHLSQPRPGTLVWTLPSGRTYTTEPEPYPV